MDELSYKFAHVNKFLKKNLLDYFFQINSFISATPIQGGKWSSLLTRSSSVTFSNVGVCLQTFPDSYF